MFTVKTDSRKIKPGDTFVAIKCEVNDGHEYIEDAIKNGASKIVCEHGSYSVLTVVVNDSRKYLEDYLQKHYNKYLENMTIIGITGTNGKTTSAYLIYTALNKLGYKCAYIGTIGYYLDKKVSSLPNTNPDICDMYEMIMEAYEKGYRYVVLEASSQGLMGKRLEGIHVDYAIFTNLTEDHLDFHKTMENYAKAKTLLFKKLKKDGVGIVNIDDAYKDFFLTDKTLTYGKGDSDYKIVDYKMDNQGVDIHLKIRGENYQVRSSLIGEYNIYNLLCAIIVLDNLKIPLEDIFKVAKTLTCPPGRMDTIKFKSNTIIIDYAHTPDALEKILKTVRETNHNNIYTVFGCTGNREKAKRPIMASIATNMSTKVIITIDDPHDEEVESIVSDMLKGINKHNFEVCLDRSKAIQKGISLLKENDYLLILGKGHEDVIIYKDKRIPFNDKKQVLEIIDKINYIEI